MNYALKHNIGVIYTHCPPKEAPSASYPENGVLVINANWKNKNEIPFIFGHELGHMLLKHDRRNFNTSPVNAIKMEHEANQFSLNLLTEYCDDMDFYFDNKYVFAETFGIPKSLYYLLDEVG